MQCSTIGPKFCGMYSRSYGRYGLQGSLRFSLQGHVSRFAGYAQALRDSGEIWQSIGVSCAVRLLRTRFACASSDWPILRHYTSTSEALTAACMFGTVRSGVEKVDPSGCISIRWVAARPSNHVALLVWQFFLSRTSFHPFRFLLARC
jgi:hypothetical protein